MDSDPRVGILHGPISTRLSGPFHDVTYIFFQMTAEWRQIDFGSSDICLLGVTKITDVSTEIIVEMTRSLQISVNMSDHLK